MPGALSAAGVELHPDEPCAMGSGIAGRHGEEKVSRPARRIENVERVV